MGRRRALRRAGVMVQAVCLSATFVQALFMVVLDVALPTIALAFDCSVEVALWASLGPSFCSAMIGPAIGRLADRYGHSRIWWAGMFFEVAQCIACSLAPTIGLLLAARSLAGLSYACSPAGFAIMCGGLPSDKRGVVSARSEALGTLGASVGLALSGVMVDQVTL